MIHHVLVVQEIRGEEATVVYAWATCLDCQIWSGFTSARAVFKGNALTVTLPRPTTVTYQMRRDGKLEAEGE